ncbi:MAG: DegT/DnrJ/EryC1/StrS family aminotransferase [Clostridia bacterium]|nr:DegT/DnrJ/EryC1/StrS family aminotransferase [Clostridia bacterium]
MKMSVKVPFSPPDITQAEIDAVSEVLRSGWITTGPKTKQFEKEIATYCGTDRAVCLNSATAAMELTLRLLGIGEGDEVITSAYTYTASASVAVHVGAKLVLCDTKKDSFEMDYDALGKLITDRTKAIIPVDLGGVICDYEKIFSVVESKKNIFRPSNDIQKKMGRIAVLADGAHSFGSMQKGKMAGSIADFTSFSFHAVKNLTTAEGGAVTWRNINGISNDDIYREYMLLSLHGQSKDALAKTQVGAWEYDIVSPAYKCNMTDIMAAIGQAQLDRYDSILEKRHEIVGIYDEAMSSLDVQYLHHHGEDFLSDGHLYLVRLNGEDSSFRNELIIRMAEEGIMCNVHYKPLPMHTAYKNLGFDIKDFPNAYAQFENEISLPLNTKMTLDDARLVAETFTRLLKG